METPANTALLSNSELVCEEALKQWLGIKQRGALRRCLQEKGIRFFEVTGKKICTTATAINAALEDNLNFDVDFEHGT